MKEKGESFYNRSLERALQILTAFSFDKQSLTLSEISEALSLSRATVLRLCSTLKKFRFLKQDPNTKQYSLGLRLFELGSIIFNSFSLRRIASHYLNELHIKLGKTLFLGIIEDDQLLYVDKLDDQMNPITFTSNIGTRRPPYWGMVGLVILAYMPEKEAKRILQKSPLKPTAKKSLTKKEEVFTALHKIRKQGYAFDDETTFDGISGIAAPIFNLTGDVVGAIGIGYITSSVDSNNRKKIIKEIISTAGNISREMGYINKNA